MRTCELNYYIRTKFIIPNAFILGNNHDDQQCMERSALYLFIYFLIFLIFVGKITLG